MLSAWFDLDFWQLIPVPYSEAHAIQLLFGGRSSSSETRNGRVHSVSPLFNSALMRAMTSLERGGLQSFVRSLAPSRVPS